jgi:hypothetical protein
MKIEQPTDNSLYVTIGDYVYYFDDSIDGEVIVKRWRTDKPMPDIEDINNAFELTESLTS